MQTPLVAGSNIFHNFNYLLSPSELPRKTIKVSLSEVYLKNFLSEIFWKPEKRFNWKKVNKVTPSKNSLYLFQKVVYRCFEDKNLMNNFVVVVYYTF